MREAREVFKTMCFFTSRKKSDGYFRVHMPDIEAGISHVMSIMGAWWTET